MEDSIKQLTNHINSSTNINEGRENINRVQGIINKYKIDSGFIDTEEEFEKKTKMINDFKKQLDILNNIVNNCNDEYILDKQKIQIQQLNNWLFGPFIWNISEDLFKCNKKIIDMWFPGFAFLPRDFDDRDILKPDVMMIYETQKNIQQIMSNTKLNKDVKMLFLSHLEQMNLDRFNRDEISEEYFKKSREYIIKAIASLDNEDNKTGGTHRVITGKYNRKKSNKRKSNKRKSNKRKSNKRKTNRKK